jgi:carbon-monoxide dehydrogenase medium subunit
VPEALISSLRRAPDHAGGTDLVLELQRGVRDQRILVDISRIVSLKGVTFRDNLLCLGALVTHSEAIASPHVVAHGFPMARACWMVGAPQIRNRGTVAGNLVTASPANDTITPLWAMDATVTLGSREAGERTLRFDEFFLGVRRTALRPDEMVLGINAPALGPNERGTFLKLGLRQQAISVTNAAHCGVRRPRAGRASPGAVAMTSFGQRTPRHTLRAVTSPTPTSKAAGSWRQPPLAPSLISAAARTTGATWCASWSRAR